MKPVLLLFAAAATIGAAPARRAPLHYEAGGFEPSWHLEIDGGRLLYNPRNGFPKILMRTPPRRAVRNGYRYESRRLVVDIRHVRCDADWGQSYVDTVRISGMEAFPAVGCGGLGIPPTDLNHSSWSIREIAGKRLPWDSDDWAIEFSDGHMSVRACHEYVAPYREGRPRLTLGALGPGEDRNCVRTEPEWRRLNRPALERRVLAILRGPLRIRFVEGDTLILTGPRGSLRLFPMP